LRPGSTEGLIRFGANNPHDPSFQCASSAAFEQGDL
jgi:hypothetical protein